MLTKSTANHLNTMALLCLRSQSCSCRLVLFVSNLKVLSLKKGQIYALTRVFLSLSLFHAISLEFGSYSTADTFVNIFLIKYIINDSVENPFTFYQSNSLNDVECFLFLSFNMKLNGEKNAKSRRKNNAHVV